MKYVGAHVSAAGGVENAPLNARAIGARAFALFVKNQRQWSARPLTPKNIEAFKRNCAELNYKADFIVPHAGYLINPGHPEKAARQKSRLALLDEIHRCMQLGIRMINFHPGSHLRKITEDACLAQIAESINILLEKSAGVSLLIENTAGQGSNVGYRFEHLAQIIDGVDDKSRVGVCLDTCHAFAAGYDLTRPESYEQVFNAFDACVGLSYLKAIHLNDSKKTLGSRVDRHESLGRGEMGKSPFQWIMNDPRFEHLPMILETPNPGRWPDEINELYGFIM